MNKIEEMQKFLDETDILMARLARDKVQFLIFKQKMDARDKRWEEEDQIRTEQIRVAHESLERSRQIGLSKHSS